MLDALAPGHPHTPAGNQTGQPLVHHGCRSHPGCATDQDDLTASWSGLRAPGRQRPDFPCTSDQGGRPAAEACSPGHHRRESDRPAGRLWRGRVVPPLRHPTPPESPAPRRVAPGRSHGFPPTRAATTRLWSPGDRTARPDSTASPGIGVVRPAGVSPATTGAGSPPDELGQR